MNDNPTDDRLRDAVGAIKAGQPDDARRLLVQIVEERGAPATVYYLLGIACQSLGRSEDAVSAFKTAAEISPDEPSYHGALGDCLERAGRFRAAEGAYRKVLEFDSNSLPAILGLVRTLVATMRAPEAVSILEPLLGSSPPRELTEAYASAARAAGLPERALSVYAASPAPGDVNRLFQKAGALIELERFDEARQLAQQIVNESPDWGAAWRALARSARGQGDYEFAQTAYAEAARHKQTDAIREAAELVWMRTGDIDAALMAVDELGGVLNSDAELSLISAELAAASGASERGLDILEEAIAQYPDKAELRIAMSRIARKTGDEQASVDHARVAVRLDPNERSARMALTEAYLAGRMFGDAAATANDLLKQAPGDQAALALLGTAWRGLGDERYANLFDAGRMAKLWRMSCPKGWSSLDHYLTALSESLTRLHDLAANPLTESVRNGTQTFASLKHSDDPAIRAFFQAVDSPIRAHIAAQGMGPRASTDYTVLGMWSVRLLSGGYHTNHIHPEGVLSTACYVDLPSAIEADGREGWLKLGEPGIPCGLGPERYLKPEPGAMAIFPSYMWHGTSPFESKSARLTIAFDIRPH